MVPVLRLAINAAASAHGLDPVLVTAIVAAESEGVAGKTRYEKKWAAFNQANVFAHKLGITMETEMMAQAHSYGLMQVMGANARDHGFESYLHELCQIELGLEYGCRYLAKQAKQYSGDDLISSYNAGTPRKASDGKYLNQVYVDTVKKKIKEG